MSPYEPGALMEASEPAAILSALAARTWAEDGREGNPDVPTAADLAAWWREAPPDEQADPTREARERLAAIPWPREWGDLTGAHWAPFSPARVERRPMTEAEAAEWGEWNPRLADGMEPPAHQTLVVAGPYPDNPADLVTLGACVEHVEPAGPQVRRTFEWPAVHRLWASTPREARPPHPLAPLLRAWWDRSPRVDAETRPDPILSTWRTGEAPEREAGRLSFGGLVPDPAPAPPGQLPLLPTHVARVALLELADLTGVPTMAQGRGAPLDLRLAVAACLFTPAAERTGRRRLAVTVRQLAPGFLWPNRYDRHNHWPRLREALARANNLTLPYTDPELGARLWFPFRLVSLPDTREASLDDVIVIDVELPPGAHAGPTIDRAELARLGVDSGPRFRAYLAAHALAWNPGRSRVPVPGAGGLWTWARDPAAYVALTEADRRRLAFSDGDKKNRTRAELAAAWETLPGLVARRVGTAEDGSKLWLVLPEAAAEAIDLHNRGTISP